jgi:hypothetical protein
VKVLYTADMASVSGGQCSLSSSGRWSSSPAKLLREQCRGAIFW